MTPWAFLLTALAAYRITRMIVIEEGPFEVFSLIRERVDPTQKSWVGRGVVCMMCVGFWVSLALSIIVGASWIEWLAMSCAIVIWREVISK